MPAARLAARDGSPLRAGRVFILSASWGLGTGLGVALGAVLTAVSGAGAPGLSGVDVTSELLVIPWIAAGVVFLVHLGVTMTAGLVRGRRARQAPPEHEQGGEGGSKNRVDGHVEREVPSAQE